MFIRKNISKTRLLKGNVILGKQLEFYKNVGTLQ